jgi:hypothetical protein
MWDFRICSEKNVDNIYIYIYIWSLENWGIAKVGGLHLRNQIIGDINEILKLTKIPKEGRRQRGVVKPQGHFHVPLGSPWPPTSQSAGITASSYLDDRDLLDYPWLWLCIAACG